jgi:hypothetical protein
MPCFLATHAGELGSKAVAAVLVSCPIVRVRLDSCSLGSEGTYHIASALRLSQRVQAVSLGSNNLTDSCAGELASAIQEHASLTKLQLCGNDLGPQAASLLGASLQVPHCLPASSLHAFLYHSSLLYPPLCPYPAPPLSHSLPPPRRPLLSSLCSSGWRLPRAPQPPQEPSRGPGLPSAAVSPQRLPCGQVRPSLAPAFRSLALTTLCDSHHALHIHSTHIHNSSHTRCQLQWLSLTGTGMGPEAALALSAWLKRGSKCPLRSLYLGENMIGVRRGHSGCQ